MGRKSYKIESEIRIDTICVPRTNMCPLDHVYINVELFGETQRTKLLHPVFPIKTSDKFYFVKTFWSPQNEGELHKLMRESPVSIELRHLQPGSKDSALFAFTDSDAYRFLIEGAQSNFKGVHSSKSLVYLNQTKYSCGQQPCVKVEVKSTISSSQTPIMDKWLGADMDLCPLCDQFSLKKSQAHSGGSHVRAHCDMYTCKCELHKVQDDHKFHCFLCHQDLNIDLSKKGLNNHDKYPQNVEDFDEERFEDGPGVMRPPFVVRKVTHDIIARKPDAYDSVYNVTVREQEQLKSSRRKKLHRLRSCSPKRDKKEKSSPNEGALKAPEVCYACSLPPNNVRLSCDSCNLTSRAEPLRGGDLVRPEPPLLRTHREIVDQRPLYSFNEMKCKTCARKKVLKTERGSESGRERGGERGREREECLLMSSRPLYELQGYRDMAKYFSSHDLRQY